MERHASFGRTGPTGQRGPPLEGKSSSILFLTEIFEHFDIMEEIERNLVKGAISGERKKGIEKLAKSVSKSTGTLHRSR